MKILYYPGCTLKNKALNYEEATIESLAKLGVELNEMERWNCCGTVFSFTSDNVMYHLAPIRNLLRVREADEDKVLTLCSMCLNTLRRANVLFNEDEKKAFKINNIMDKEEQTYDGQTSVLHLIDLLVDIIGMEKIENKLGKSLSRIKAAAYYGCMLLRPDGIGIDDAENPVVFEKVLSGLGAEAIKFPLRGDCCGAYQTVPHPEVAGHRTYAIVNSARKAGANCLIVSCPLCAFNLDQRQAEVEKTYPDFEKMPVLYLGELLYLALGLKFKSKWEDLHYVGLEGILSLLEKKEELKKNSKKKVKRKVKVDKKASKKKKISPSDSKEKEKE